VFGGRRSELVGRKGDWVVREGVEEEGEGESEGGECCGRVAEWGRREEEGREGRVV
jgi:hypothetical protein